MNPEELAALARADQDASATADGLIRVEWVPSEPEGAPFRHCLECDEPVAFCCSYIDTADDERFDIAFLCVAHAEELHQQHQQRYGQDPYFPADANFIDAGFEYLIPDEERP